MSVLFRAAILMACVLSSEGFLPPAAVSSVRGESTASALGMATWSNGQAIKEYQDFLASGEYERYIVDEHLCPSYCYSQY